MVRWLSLILIFIPCVAFAQQAAQVYHFGPQGRSQGPAPQTDQASASAAGEAAGEAVGRAMFQQLWDQAHSDSGVKASTAPAAGAYKLPPPPNGAEPASGPALQRVQTQPPEAVTADAASEIAAVSALQEQTHALGKRLDQIQSTNTEAQIKALRDENAQLRDRVKNLEDALYYLVDKDADLPKGDGQGLYDRVNQLSAEVERLRAQIRPAQTAQR